MSNRTPEPSRKITLQDVRASLNPNIKAHYSIRFFGRPLANVVTPMFYNFGVSANAVTMARIYLSIVAVLVLLDPTPISLGISVAAYYLGIILDSVDGNVARLRSTVTYWGKFIDGLADYIYVQAAPFVVAVGLWWVGESPAWIIVGAAVTIATLTHQMVRSRLSFFREWMVSISGPLTDADVASTQTPKRIQAFASGAFVNGTFLAPALLLWPETGPQVFLVATVLAILGAEMLWLIGTLMEARAILNRPRRSIHSPPVSPEEVSRV